MNKKMHGPACKISQKYHHCNLWRKSEATGSHRCGILPKNCHLASSLLDTQTSPFRRVESQLIPPGRESQFIPPGQEFRPADATFIRMSYCRHSTRPTFHLLRVFHIRRLPPDGREVRFNFPRQTCLDPLVALTRRISAADNSASPDSLARQILAIRRIHFRPQLKR